ncbi:hypothetical protein GUJ93_ZPchr0004g40102 [Zizania palustris]|uniref:Uncharacterized protein n=1 Tax=Zizania palustris TaxID=103762 RepID=A0A8J5VFT3_ZIZPA|nr:hypothetical protein GUJ93_ZPchr0004g40102 [Zizania palustris]
MGWQAPCAAVAPVFTFTSSASFLTATPPLAGRRPHPPRPDLATARLPWAGKPLPLASPPMRRPCWPPFPWISMSRAGRSPPRVFWPRAPPAGSHLRLRRCGFR